VEEPEDDDENSNSRSQRTTSVGHTNGGSGPKNCIKKNTAVSDVNEVMIEELQDHGVGLGDMDAWLSRDVSFGKIWKDV
jgi:hypothetical protein